MRGDLNQVDLYSERKLLLVSSFSGSVSAFFFFFMSSFELVFFAVSDAVWICLFGCFLFCCFFSFLGALALLRVVAVLVAVLFVQ